MSIKRFETEVIRTKKFRAAVTIQSPLTIVTYEENGADRECGFITRFLADVYTGAVPVGFHRLGVFTRTTYWTDMGRRKLKGQTTTTDRMEVWTIGTSSNSYTDFGSRHSRYGSGAPSSTFSKDRWSSLSTPTAGLSFDAQYAMTMLRGVVELEDGVGFIDWLRENSTEIAPLFNTPGWMPANWETFRAERDKRRKDWNEAIARMKAVSDDPTENSSEPDRWR